MKYIKLKYNRVFIFLFTVNVLFIMKNFWTMFSTGDQEVINSCFIGACLQYALATWMLHNVIHTAKPLEEVNQVAQKIS